ncbi:helix-turn-helix domain-containing protein [Streptomyces sp. H10-C2]|uniref:IclR family transcriptional regulator n=1 Tax=unclassified Streptomyces TaxID=2593676 RepID=UPI0024BB34E0|nr:MULTISPECIES: helix-turn-helix domain-containing protein [unclassified Streptomyces]MDJ0346932.1 helix-turn-helix domain-containing protein [Streptomyces sp. PH10-H1]MDJ0374324.1 helix-turn-helix domain-containing protein [Streptomyces sp. H10-C2]
MTPPTLSGVGVLDKTSLIIDALEAGPATFAEIADTTGLARSTVHRLALALEQLRLLSRDRQGRFVLGSRLGERSAEDCRTPRLSAAGPVLNWLRDTTGTSARLYRRVGPVRVCLMSAEPSGAAGIDGPTGAAFPMKSGAASQVLLAWEGPDQLYRGLLGAQFNAATLAGVRRQGWAQSINGQPARTVSVAAPVRSPGNRVVAAIALSGPVELLSRHPVRSYGRTVMNAALRLGQEMVL